jgi:hypothetical protein
MIKNIAFALLVQLISWYPVFAQQWRNIGPDSMVWTSSDFFIQGDLLYIYQRSTRPGVYYEYNLKVKSGWRKRFVDNYCQDSPTEVQCNNTAWFTNPSCDGGIAKVDGNDSQWQKVDIPDLSDYVGCGHSDLLCVAGDTITKGICGYCFSGLPCIPAYFGVFLSEDNGKTWKSLIRDKNCQTAMYSVLIAGNAVFASINRGILRFDRETLDSTVMPAPSSFYRMYECDETYFGVSRYNSNDLYRSGDSCKSWTSVKNGLDDSIWISCIKSYAGNVYLSSFNTGLFVYNSSQEMWVSCLNMLPEIKVAKLGTRNGALFAATEHGVYEYNDATRVSAEKSSAPRRRLTGLRSYYSGKTDRYYLSDGKKTTYNLLGKRVYDVRSEMQNKRAAAAKPR